MIKKRILPIFHSAKMFPGEEGVLTAVDPPITAGTSIPEFWLCSSMHAEKDEKVSFSDPYSLKPDPAPAFLLNPDPQCGGSVSF